MMVFVAEIKGRGIAAFQADNGSDAEQIVRDQLFRDDLTALISDGLPLWDGVADIRVRQARPDEEARWRASRAKAIRHGDIEGGEIVEVKRPAPVKVEKAEPFERVDNAVGMYLRTIGSIELLSRTREIAIAKRIEAGREAMIAGLCESPLSFQAIIIWRDELNEGKVFLRDIIDLEATYAGPDAKAIP